LPHLIAFTLVGAADDLESVAEAEIIKYSAGGFRDFTRIAASDPVMWRDVFLNNREAVLEVLGRFTEELALLQRAIRWGDAEQLTKVFTRGREIRRAIVAAGQESDVANFGRDQKKD
jgi:cyclohexadieny/prephenate dehydrogenase